jgi:type IV pilus assembly protein PilB
LAYYISNKSNKKSMPVVIDPNSTNSSNQVSLSSIPDDRLFRLNKVQGDLNREFNENLTARKAQEYGLKYVNLWGYPITAASLDIFSKRELETLKMGIFNVRGNILDMVIFYIGSDVNTAQQQKLNILKEQGWEIEYYFGSTLSYDKLMRSYDLVIEKKNVSDEINLSSTDMDKYNTTFIDKTNLQTLLDNTTSTTELLEIILSTGASNQASDIHFEPDELTYVIKMRLDGVMVTMAKLPKEKQKELEMRVKLISKLKINISDVPQDGRFSFGFDGLSLDMRVSMLPSNYGYSVVMRILGNKNVDLKLDSLGFGDYHQSMINRAIQKNQGLILTCGPTGSGKTTTLYTMLTSLNDGKTKIITLEDPIEYKLDGISQTQIDTQKGVTFASSLRSVLRQDPDIIMVGEIRDYETGETAVNAALTGHKVLSTLHTNDAVGALPRMIEMGVKGYLFADATSLIIGQRLVRKSCTFCQKDVNLDPYTYQRFNDAVQKLQSNPLLQDRLKNLAPTFKKSEGCAKCNNTGYKGRVGVYEVFEISPELKIMLEENTTNPAKIRQILEQNNFITMFQDGILKVIDGLTDIEEVMRVLQ